MEVPLNQVTKRAEIPKTLHVDKVVVMAQQVPQFQIALKTLEIPPAKFVGRVVEALVTMQMRQCRLSRQRTRSKSDISERTQIVSAPVLQITVPVPFQEEIVEVTKLDPEKCSARDVDEILETIKDIPLELIFEGVAKKILALPMEPWQCEESCAVREKIADRYA